MKHYNANDLRKLLATPRKGAYEGSFCTFTAAMVEDTDYGTEEIVPYTSEIEPGGKHIIINGNSAICF